jgi:predicted nuclease of predicted toxin-antitoxin system
MTIWVDAQLSPAIANWITDHFGIASHALRELSLRDAGDLLIFRAAADPETVILTKDVDFVHLVKKHGPPPRVLWLTCGNTSNAALRSILSRSLPGALRLLEAGDPFVEIASFHP